MSTLPDFINIAEIPDFGVVLKCSDVEVADRLEDFFTEECFVLFQVRLEPNEVAFFFGQAGSSVKVAELCNLFFSSMGISGKSGP
ncbi:MAG: hypothetical protein IPF83_12130 [Rhodanobacteraceae bacterium]|nr:hypothetical protein [Rhodanobacteraceae bacterium]MBK7044204.1 hypothetical protein [Rhodanobacteraceae bacterium]MBP9154222.1 hypothetical protein [Xanthomonadales bacterium]HQW80375.1 hypothetical protein [Pseudomonadota bacterium]